MSQRFSLRMSGLVLCVLLTYMQQDAASAEAQTCKVSLTVDELRTTIRERINQSNSQSGQITGAQSVGWSNVAMGGGGYVTGIAIHPKVKNIVYVRTDVSGFFRWDEAAKIWIPLTDFLGPDEANDYGGESIALDPNDAESVYIATGLHDASWANAGKIYRSKDRGRTWTKISPDWQVKMGGGEFRRWAGERLAVSPTNSQVILFGSRRDGLWRTQDGGQNWQQQKFSGLDATYGIQSIVFDPNKAGLVYAAFYGLGIYRSTDDGATWSLIPGGPAKGMRLALSSAGTLWATHEGGVSKLAANSLNGWTSFQPAGNGAQNTVYNAVAVNPQNEQDIVVALTETYSFTPTYRSRDGGASWQAIAWNYANTVPWVAQSDYGGDVWFQGEKAAFAFDPTTPNRFWMTNWFFASRSDDIQGSTPTLSNNVYNLENTVNLALATNRAGELLSGFADTGGFFHDQGFARYPSAQLPKVGGQSNKWNYVTGLAVMETNPDVVYRVGCTCWNNTNGLAKSSDGGKTWTLTHEWSVDEEKRGRPLRVAVSPTDANNIVVTRFGAPTQFSVDGGRSWGDAIRAGATPNNAFYWGQPLVADGAKANTFYYYDDVAKTVSRSDDGGRTFNVVASGLTNRDAGDRHGYLEATPGIAGELWLALDGNGLYRSTDAGVTWTKKLNVTQARTVAIGKAALPELPPTLYIYGKIDGKSGIWMSIDTGQSWFNIQHPNILIGVVPNNLKASRTEFGRLFVGTVGRGVFTFTLGF